MMRRLTAGLAAVVLALTALACMPDDEPAQAAGGPVTIMPLGDSITSGHGSSTGDGYRWNLGDRIVLTGGINAYYVGSQRNGQGPNRNNEGHPGYTINQITAGVPTWMASVPDLTLLYIGVNDARNGRTVVQMLDDMSVLLDTILARSATNRVIVAKLIVPNGINTQLRATSVTVQAFNDSLTQLAASKGPRVEVANMSIIPTSSLGDGLHPNDTGYRQMAWVWYRSMAGWYGQGGYLPWSEVPFPVVPQLN